MALLGAAKYKERKGKHHEEGIVLQNFYDRGGFTTLKLNSSIVFTCHIPTHHNPESYQ